MRFSTALILIALVLVLTSWAADVMDPAGYRPLGADGKPLNLDFETGTLKDWTADGEAFVGQPIKGDTVHPRRGDMRSEHQGEYWIGGYERLGDRPTGTLTSVPFRVTHPWCSFLVGGGPHPETSVEIYRKDGNALIQRVSGLEEENLKRAVVDLTPHLGKEIYIRLVDRHTGHWGHVNFDDFRFHAAKPDVPVRKNPQALPPPDSYKHAGLSPQDAARAMTVPPGFEVKLFAGEPDVHQPIGFCLDDRGRLWVAEAYCYPQRQPEGQGKDRILIFEDADGDGKHDKRTVFMEGLNLVSGIEYGFGGLWVGAAPYLMYIPIKDDKPAGEPKLLLDGWGWQDTHETLNSFIWGPDGWLYGCHGVFTHSRVGKPGTPDKDRIPINAGIWRYHPTRHVFEVFAHGTSNPWGFDFNDWGQAFCEACVIPHNWHIVQGARYHRQAGSHFNPYTFDDIKTIAEHRHYVGPNPHGGNNRSDSAGGGHAHCGTMIYLGGTWPAEYRNQMFMGNIHGRRLNVDRLTPKGSGYVASRAPDFLFANDAWARFINLRYGPDGNVFLIDWYDEQACHHNDPRIWNRSNGRIYKICWKAAKPLAGVDLSKAADKELLDHVFNNNDWYVRHSRRLLHERAAERKLEPAMQEALANIALQHEDETRRLRGLWAAYVAGGLDAPLARRLLDANSEHLRAWTARLVLDDPKLTDETWKQLLARAEGDPSPVVRLALAGGAQRLPLERRWELLGRLLVHPEDATDHNLPLMYWYAAEPLADVDPARALELGCRSRIGLVLEFMARKLAVLGRPETLEIIADRLKTLDDASKQLAILRGTNEGLRGRRQAPMPPSWPAAFALLGKSSEKQVLDHAFALAVTFGDPQALARLRETLTSTQAPLTSRNNALSALLNVRDKDLAPILHGLLADNSLRGPALKGLASYDDPKTPTVILQGYAEFTPSEKRDALTTLAARPAYGKALLDAVAARKIPSSDISADIVRQLRNLGDAELDQRIADVWGVVRSTPAERLQAMRRTRNLIVSAGPAPDLALGRAVYARTCMSCHTLFGVGSNVGPDITGANRASLDYLLENVLDPSAVIPKEYSATIIRMSDGRIITGIVKGETPAALTVVTQNETLTLPREEIEAVKPSATSLMPDDQLKPMTNHEIRSLFAYLQSPNQTPMLATRENARDFFNGKDLNNWDGDKKLWSVENGEIVGRSPGLKHNEFLKSHMVAGDFRLTLKVKLTPNKENSGIQFRSEALPGGDVKGYQADIGQGWWGKLYEEHGRAVLSNKSGEPHVKVDDWNDYEIIAEGSRIKTFINGKPCVDLDDPPGARRGIFALQLHSGGPLEIRFKDLKLEVK